MEAQLAERKTEPNSGLGKAIRYMLRHWMPLTLFLREPGVPIDNNIVERILKKAILHRKNSLFYKTLNGARVGDLFMSLIHTCELNGGCLGITARHWHGWQDPPPRNILPSRDFVGR
jgi:transposase